MFGNFDGVMVYGFPEGDTGMVLDREWLSQKFPAVQVTALRVVKNNLDEACYGVPARVQTDGRLNIKPEAKQQVDSLWKAFYDFHMGAPLASEYTKNIENGSTTPTTSDCSSPSCLGKNQVAEPDSPNLLSTPKAIVEMSGQRSPCFMSAVVGDFETEYRQKYTLDDEYDQFVSF